MECLGTIRVVVGVNAPSIVIKSPVLQRIGWGYAQRIHWKFLDDQIVLTKCDDPEAFLVPRQLKPLDPEADTIHEKRRKYAPDDDAQAYRLLFQEKMTWQDVALAIGAPVSSVRYMAKRHCRRTGRPWFRHHERGQREGYVSVCRDPDGAKLILIGAVTTSGWPLRLCVSVFQNKEGLVLVPLV
ncbi:MAG: hypothetical protein UY76_C0045G0014 [Candidatus Uhrbacteria bacterium GW2011_GWA2_52_8d]|uniref:Uncharacterized protein n=1 Tax=Candidatus Uhrbacteria bacterium GW2011_GWA2_52_8d TaxID=1618979 RepID=A0A0G2AHH1_9BACT|nr:MAG: hypothetical protein UY76_C0045G0014 [Candidatus Uhrbacteria bacterium GW2011_GWA2_52_8d]